MTFGLNPFTVTAITDSVNQTSNGGFMNGLSNIDLSSSSGAFTSTLSTVMNSVFPFSGQVIGLLDSIDFLGVFSGVTDIFANGFDLSCYNSSLNTTEMTLDLQEHLLPMYQAKVADVQNSLNESQLSASLTELDKFSSFISVYFYNKLNSNNWNNCSKKALEMAKQFTVALHTKTEQTVLGFKQHYNVTKTQRLQTIECGSEFKFGSFNGLINNCTNKAGSMDYKNYNYNQYTLTLKNNEVGSNGENDQNNDPKKSNITNLVVGVILSKVFGVW